MTSFLAADSLEEAWTAPCLYWDPAPLTDICWIPLADGWPAGQRGTQIVLHTITQCPLLTSLKLHVLILPALSPWVQGQRHVQPTSKESFFQCVLTPTSPGPTNLVYTEFSRLQIGRKSEVEPTGYSLLFSSTWEEIRELSLGPKTLKKILRYPKYDTCVKASNICMKT